MVSIQIFIAVVSAFGATIIALGVILYTHIKQTKRKKVSDLKETTYVNIQ